MNFFIKNFRRADKKWRGFRGGNFLPASRFFCFVPARPAERRGGQLFFSRIFDKVSSSVVVNILIEKKSLLLGDFSFCLVLVEGIERAGAKQAASA
ncbi:MAG: hypothetical protein CO139_03885 [Candidatus Moranbacteria bacterium CG_4_9_14_3_um_filter_36_9]|nr:MAG: hypothetical protein CO139_03885 [Candidatus Moranbacteria bacterium CG_4_9_14_3_um_filter_36_9]